MMRNPTIAGTLLLAALLGSECVAASCPADLIPIRLVDPSNRAPVTTLSTIRWAEHTPAYREFVTAISQHLAARLADPQHCPASAASQQRSLLRFVRWTLVYPAGSPPQVFTTLKDAPTRGCQLHSPWLDLSIERGPVPWVQGIVRWNERQLLADQARLAGLDGVVDGVAMPFSAEAYGKLAEAMGWVRQDYHGVTPAATEPQLPPELRWLHRYSTRNDLPPSADGVYAVLPGSAERYTRLTLALIDRCLASEGQDIRYGHIQELADLLPLDEYRVPLPNPEVPFIIHDGKMPGQPAVQDPQP
ncbi:hypothetical protein [Leeia sp.]|uniref:hypothetical protein n=1 Tax=Leeia sp. TaxID=2884678 RepID=UPI0035AE96DD